MKVFRSIPLTVLGRHIYHFLMDVMQRGRHLRSQRRKFRQPEYRPYVLVAKYYKSTYNILAEENAGRGS